MDQDLIERVVQDVINKVNNKENINMGYSYIVPIGISNRHVHLSKDVMEKLFGKGSNLTPLKDLKQPGEFACHEQVDLVYGDKLIEKVRVLGPLRKQTQVEISQTDARKLKVNLKVRNSGDLKGTHQITLRTKLGEVTLEEGLIIATRHLHLTTEDAKLFNIKHEDKVAIRINGEKPGVIEQVSCKVNDNYVLELHLDTDDGNAFLVNNGSVAELIR